MATAAVRAVTAVKLPGIGASADAVRAADKVLATAKVAVARRVAGSTFDAEQAAAHGFAWLATTVEALRQMHAWADAPRR